MSALTRWPTIYGGFCQQCDANHIDEFFLYRYAYGMTQLRHYDHWGTARFITFSSYRRYRIFDSRTACEVMIEQIARLRSDASVKLLGYVLMPEHVHLVVWPPLDTKLGLVIGQMKARAAQAILHSWDGVIPELLLVNKGAHRHQVFQRRCYDHNCRTVDTVKEKIDYCHKNPVTRGLVDSPDGWMWSSTTGMRANEMCRWQWMKLSYETHHKWWATQPS